MEILITLAFFFAAYVGGFLTARVLDPVLDKRRAKAKKAAASRARYAAKKDKVASTTKSAIKTAKQPMIME